VLSASPVFEKHENSADYALSAAPGSRGNRRGQATGQDEGADREGPSLGRRSAGPRRPAPAAVSVATPAWTRPATFSGLPRGGRSSATRS